MNTRFENKIENTFTLDVGLRNGIISTSNYVVKVLDQHFADDEELDYEKMITSIFKYSHHLNSDRNGRIYYINIGHSRNSVVVDTITGSTYRNDGITARVNAEYEIIYVLNKHDEFVSTSDLLPALEEAGQSLPSDTKVHDCPRFFKFLRTPTYYNSSGYMKQEVIDFSYRCILATPGTKYVFVDDNDSLVPLKQGITEDDPTIRYISEVNEYGYPTHREY